MSRIFLYLYMAMLGVQVAVLLMVRGEASKAGWIAFTSVRDGNMEIYQMLPNGSQVRRLTRHPLRDYFPSWSPNGRQLAFTSERRRVWGIFRMDRGGIEQITNEVNGYAPSWSPNGEWLVFTSEQDHNRELYKVRVDGSDLTRLTVNPADDFSPHWWGEWIVFTTTRDGNREIYKMATDGRSVTRLTRHPQADEFPRWSPNGEWIAFSSERDNNREIYKMRADGTEVTRLTFHRADDLEPSWSPNGEWLVFVSDRAGNGDIYRMGADGSWVERLTTDVGYDLEPSWSPSISLRWGGGWWLVGGIVVMGLGYAHYYAHKHGDWRQAV